MLYVVMLSSRWMLRACMWWAAWMLALMSPIVATAAGEPPAQNMTLVGAFGGAMNTIAVHGNHAYIGQGLSVDIWDVSDPTQPQRVGHSDILPGDVKAIVVDADYGYAAMGVAGVAVIDMSDLRAPRFITALGTVGSAEDVVMVGNRLFVACGLAGLRIYDVSDPANAKLLGTLNTPGFAQDLALDGDRVYLADGRGGLRIVDVTTPATPTELSTFDTPEEITGVAFGDNFAYLVGKASSNLRAIDVSNPASPREESVVNAGYSLDHITLVGEYLYLSADSYSLRIISRDPFLLNQVGEWSDFPIVDMAITGSHAFIVGGERGLTVLDVDPPAAVGAVAHVATLTHASRIAVQNNVAYVTEGAYSVAVLDASDPQQITRKSGIASHGNVWIQLAVAGNTLIIDSVDSWAGSRGLEFFTLTETLAPSQIGGRWATENQWYSPRIATHGDRIFVAEAYSGVSELNPADLSGEPLALFRPEQGSIRSVAIAARGNLLLAATGERLLFIDITTPGAPQLRGEIVGSYGGDMNGSGDFVYAYNATTRHLDVIDIQVLEVPNIIASLDLSGESAKRILSVGNLLVIANGSAGVRVVDIATPAAPKEVAYYDPSVDVSGIAWEANRVYVAANDMGLMVLDIDEDILPPPRTMMLPLLAR